MHIIFGQDVEEIRQKHLVLELETFIVAGKPTTAYCLVPPESIKVEEMPDLARYKGIHEALIDALNRKDWSTVSEGITHLRGKFNGELDSFYDILEQERIPRGDKE
jgi:hypothetical protein